MKVKGAPFSDAARNLRQIGRSPATLLCVSVILAIHLVVSLAGGPGSGLGNGIYHALGLNREGIIHGGVWRLFTYGLLHGTWVHVFINGLCVLLLGSRIEHMLGGAALVKTLIYGVLAGGVGHLMLAGGGFEAPLLVGLSGGCVALLLLLTTLSPESRMMPLPVSGRSLGLGIMAAELILALLDPALGLPGFADAGHKLVGLGMAGWFEMGHACHVGGGMAGWILGRRVLRPRVTLSRLRRDRARREARITSR